MRLSLERTTFIILVALLTAIAVRVPADTDTWWHLRSAEHTLTQGMIYTDPFSHTFTGQRWINHSWGGQIVLLAMYNTLGNVGLSLYTAVLGIGGILVLFPVMRGPVLLRAFVLVLAAATAAMFWSARPLMLSFFLSAVFLSQLYHYQQAPSRRIVLLVPLMALWANLHAGYSIGFIFMGAFIVGMTLNRLLGGYASPSYRDTGVLMAVAVACIGATVLTPYGIDTLLVPFETVNIDALREFVQEWNSPNFQQRQTWPLIGMVVLSIAGAWLSRLKWDWISFFLWGGTLFMMLLYVRNVAVFAVAATPIISAWLYDALTVRGWVLRPRRVTTASVRLNWVLVIIVWLGVGIYVVGGVWPANVIDRYQRTTLPVAVAEFLNENRPAGPMFNSYNWGGYLMWAAPDYPVFIDGRTDLYGEFVREYVVTSRGTGNWQETLDRYGIQLVVVENGVALDRALGNVAEWRQIYSDDMAVIYARGENE